MSDFAIGEPAIQPHACLIHRAYREVIRRILKILTAGRGPTYMKMTLLIFYVACLLTPTETVASVKPPEIHRNIQTLTRIRECESGGNDLARNAHSTAKGRYQFLDGTWEYYGKKLWGPAWVEKDVLNGDHQQELAEFVAVKYGLGDWDASYWCWGLPL